MKYPLRTDYETVVKYPDRFIYDGILQQGKPVKQKQNQNFLLSHNGGKAVVYEIQTNPKKYALKCWIEEWNGLMVLALKTLYLIILITRLLSVTLPKNS